MLKSNAVSSRALSLSAIHARTVAACFTLFILLKMSKPLTLTHPLSVSISLVQVIGNTYDNYLFMLTSGYTEPYVNS